MASLLRLGVLVMATLAVVVLPAGAAQRDLPTLTAIVGTNDSFTITLNDATGKKVERLVPGTYTVVVQDRSAIHNFHLASNDDSTVDFRTDVEFVGEKTFTATFKDDMSYAYACEPHWRSMNGSFFVTTEPPPPPPPPVRRLSAVVAASGAVALNRSVVPAGRYRVTVRDRGKHDNFHVRGRGVNKRTGMGFRGTVSWLVTLSSGLYHYGSDRRGLRHRLRVR